MQVCERVQLLQPAVAFLKAAAEAAVHKWRLHTREEGRG